MVNAAVTLVVLLASVFVHGLHNTKENVYRVLIIKQAPFVYINEGQYTGYNIDLLNLIKEKLPFSFNYELSEVKDGSYGTLNDKGEWNGMIGQLINGDVDVALGPLTFTAERGDYVDFTLPYYNLVGITIMMKKDERDHSFFKFAHVLEWPVWLAILCAYLLTGILLNTFDVCSPFSHRNEANQDETGRRFSLTESLWYCITCLTPQGGGEAPKNTSGRLIAITWWLFGFIIIVSYTANLAAFLTISRLEIPIRSFDQLMKQNKIKFAPIEGSVTADYFERLSKIENKFYEIWQEMSLNDTTINGRKMTVWDYPLSDKYIKLWNTMKMAKLPKNASEAIERVLASEKDGKQFAFIGDESLIRYLEITDCRLEKVGESFAKKPYAIAFKKGSQLTKDFSNAIMQLLNERKLEQLQERWWTFNRNRKKCPESYQNTKGIGIRDTAGIFIVVFSGLFVAVIILIWEYCYYKRKPEAKKITDENLLFDGEESIPLKEKITNENKI